MVFTLKRLFSIQQNLDLFLKRKSVHPIILTPNLPEFNRLLVACNEQKLVTIKNDIDLDLLELSRALQCTIILKGEFDKISDGEAIVICNEPGSNRRCGGQGDLLTGMIATFLHFGMKQKIDSAPVLAAYTASKVTSLWLGTNFISKKIKNVFNFPLHNLWTNFINRSFERSHPVFRKQIFVPVVKILKILA